MKTTTAPRPRYLKAELPNGQQINVHREVGRAYLTGIDTRTRGALAAIPDERMMLFLNRAFARNRAEADIVERVQLQNRAYRRVCFLPIVAFIAGSAAAAGLFMVMMALGIYFLPALYRLILLGLIPFIAFIATYRRLRRSVIEANQALFAACLQQFIDDIRCPKCREPLLGSEQIAESSVRCVMCGADVTSTELGTPVEILSDQPLPEELAKSWFRRSTPPADHDHGPAGYRDVDQSQVQLKAE